MSALAFALCGDYWTATCAYPVEPVDWSNAHWVTLALVM
jgi:hypothetical protein